MKKPQERADFIFPQRRFIFTKPARLFTVSVKGRLAKAAFFKMKILTPEQLTLGAFSPWLKTKFRVILAPAGFLELELVEVNAITSPSQAKLAAKGQVQEVFSLVFHGPDSQLLPQRIYSFEHDQMGRFDLFIVPIGQKPGFIQYQALFNRLVKPK